MWRGMFAASIAVGVSGLIFGSFALLQVNDLRGEVRSTAGDVTDLRYNVTAMEDAWVGLDSSYSCDSPYFSKENFFITFRWVNFGKEIAHNLTVEYEIGWGGGNTRSGTVILGDAWGLTMGHRSVSESVETGGCDGTGVAITAFRWT